MHIARFIFYLVSTEVSAVESLGKITNHNIADLIKLVKLKRDSK